MYKLMYIYIYIKKTYHNHNHVCIQRSYANFPPVLRLGLCPLKHGSGFSMSSLTGLPRPTTLTAPELQLVQGARQVGSNDSSNVDQPGLPLKF